jgi:hypothetical protein
VKSFLSCCDYNGIGTSTTFPFLLERVTFCKLYKDLSDTWIDVKEKLPNKKEYLNFRKDGTCYYKRLTIAFQTDTIEYDIGYYDGYKWFTERGRRIQNVVAWKPFILYEK